MKAQLAERRTDQVVAPLLAWNDVVAFRASGDRSAFERIQKACLRYVSSRFASGLTEDDCLDAVQSALTDLYPLLTSPKASPEQVDRSLRQALERHRKRAKRRNLRLAHPDPERYFVSPSDALIARYHFLEVVRTIETVMEQSLHSLSERDRALVESHYGLNRPTSRATTADGSKDTRSDAAKKKALWRARQRLNRELELRLVLEINRAENKRSLFEEALAIVRGGATETAFDLRGVV